MNLSRRNFIKKSSLLFAMVSTMPWIACDTKYTKQNILFIVIDDLNDWIGCLNGHSQSITPNIDRLAKQGILFTNAHCPAPVCGPSRAAIFTGRQPWNTSVFTNSDKDALRKIGREFPTLMQSLKKIGYNTFGAGKLLHGNIDMYPKEELFTEYGPRYNKWQPFNNEEIKYTDEEFSSATDKSLLFHKVDRLNVKLPLNKMPRERNIGSRNIDSFDWGALPVSDSEMSDYNSAKWAIQMIKQKHDNPFFLGVGFYRPHIPLYVPQKYYNLFNSNKVELPKVLENDLDDLPLVARDIALKEYTAGTHKNVIKHNQWQEAVTCYLACVAFVDAQIGRILDALEKSQYRDNTIIVLWSDNGWHLGEKKHWGKFTGWEESTHVPLIIVPAKNSSKDYAIGHKCDKPVSLLDLYPTILDLLHLPKESYLDGKSLVPLLKNPQANFANHVITTFGRGNHTICTEKWRYVHYYDGSEELYDIKKDPNEFYNLAYNPKYNKIKQELKSKLPKYDDVNYFVSMKYWKAVIYKNRNKTELFNFKDNKAVPEENNVAAKYPEIIDTMLQYIHENGIKEKYVSIPD